MRRERRREEEGSGGRRAYHMVRRQRETTTETQPRRTASALLHTWAPLRVPLDKLQLGLLSDLWRPIQSQGPEEA